MPKYIRNNELVCEFVKEIENEDNIPLTFYKKVKKIKKNDMVMLKNYLQAIDHAKNQNKLYFSQAIRQFDIAE